MEGLDHQKLGFVTSSLYNKSKLANPRRSTPLKPLSPCLKLLHGLNIAMNFSISMVLISLSNDSNDVATNPGPVCSFALPPPNVHGLKISHLNIQSISPKIDSIRSLMKDKPFNIFSTSETWLKPSISDSEVAIPGYPIVRMDRQGKIGGGTENPLSLNE